MITANLKPYTHSRRSEGLDAYGQPSNAFLPIGVVEVSVYLQTQVANTTDVRYKDATHIGLTNDKSLLIGDKLEADGVSYRVMLVNNAGRMAQLTLKGE